MAEQETLYETLLRLLQNDFNERRTSLVQKHEARLKSAARLYRGKATKEDMKMLVATTGVGFEKLVQYNEERLKFTRG